MSGFTAVDHAALRLQRWCRSHALLYRLTIGTRVLLVAGFLPTGLVKLLGRRFSTMSPATPLGGFFETLLVWDYDRLRGVIGYADGGNPSPLHVGQPRLSGPRERGVYVVGCVAGVAMFSAFRGLLPMAWARSCFVVAAASVVAAAYLGVRRRHDA